MLSRALRLRVPLSAVRRFATATSEQELAGSVKPYSKHVVVATGTSKWSPEIAEGDAYIAALQRALKSSAELQARITASDVASMSSSGRDLFVFPESVQFPAVKEADFARLVGSLVGANGALTGKKIEGRTLLVCTHGERDERCGTVGGAVYERIREELAKRGLSQSVSVYRTSHVGGHVFAGNVIVYPEGHWYGRVTVDDVPRLIDSVMAGEIAAENYRGSANMTKEEQCACAKKAAQDKEAKEAQQASSSGQGTGGDANAASGQAPKQTPTPAPAGPRRRARITLTFVDAQGGVKTAEGVEGENVMEVAKAGRVDIEGACGGAMACSTCHVIFPADVYAQLPAPSDEENDMLDMLDGEGVLTQTSRLGCQIKLTESLDGVKIALPAVRPNFE